MGHMRHFPAARVASSLCGAVGRTISSLLPGMRCTRFSIAIWLTSARDLLGFAFWTICRKRIGMRPQSQSDNSRASDSERACAREVS